MPLTLQPLLRLPSYLLNGALAALGVAVVHSLVGAAAGSGAASLALTGAVCVSITDVTVAMVRAWRQLVAAAIATLAGTALVLLAQPSHAALGFALALGGALAMMVLSWGPWLRRRLGVLQKDAQAVQQAAWALSQPRT